MKTQRLFRRHLIVLIFILVLILSYYNVQAQGEREVAFTRNFKPVLANDRIILKLHLELDKSKVKFVNGIVTTGIKSLDLLHERYHVHQMTSLFPGSEGLKDALAPELARIYRIEFPAMQDIAEIVATYANDTNIEYAQPVGIHRVYGTIPNDLYFSNQWGMTRIHAPEAWDITHGDSSVILAIVDTGVDWLHPDLGGSTPFTRGNIWTNWKEFTGATGVDDDKNGYIDDIRGWDWVHVTSSTYPPYPGEDGTVADNDPMDFNGHGTHCAGIASAMTNNSTGVAGLGWNCKIMALRGGWSAQYGGSEIGLVSMDFCAQAIYYAARNGAVAVNCSWGSSNTGGIAEAVSFATARGVIVVTAAGNDDLSDASYLASRHDCIAVAASNPNDNKASYSSYGFWVDVSAPGGDSPPNNNQIYSTYYDHVNKAHTYEWLSGTSMAAPQVVGLVGLVSSQLPGLGWSAIKERIQFTCDNIDGLNPDYKNGLLGEGRINAFSAVSQTNLPTLTTFFSESFNTGLPSTWEADPFWRDDDPANRNTLFDDLYTPGTIRVGYDIWTPPFMIVDSYYEGNVTIDASLISPIIDCSMYSNLRLVFNNWFQNYYSGNIERGDIDIKIGTGPWQNVAGFVSDTYYNAVDAGKDIVIRLPASINYQKEVQIRWHYYNANDEWFWGIDNVKLMGEMIATNYYVQLTPSYQTSGGQAGDTISYLQTIKNIGLLSDSYDLIVSGNLWNTTTWDSSGTIQMSNTGILTSRDELAIMIKVEIPADAKIGEKDQAQILAASSHDSLVFAKAKLSTTVKAPPDTIPWFEDFPTIILDTTNWIFNKGKSEISTLGLNAPSPPYSLNLNGQASGGDEIQSCAIDLSGASQVVLGFYYQRTGSGDSPEPGDNLFIDYNNSSGAWVNLKQYPGDGPDMTFFLYDKILLPSNAYHKDFRIRFRNIANPGNYDDWFVDNILIAGAPEISVLPIPDPFNFTVTLGDSAAGTIIIGNDGETGLSFEISDAPSNLPLNSNLQLTGAAAQDILMANYDYSQTRSSGRNYLNGLDAVKNNPGTHSTRLSYILQEMLAARQNTIHKQTISAMVVHGFGTYSISATETWDYLNQNYSQFGSQPIVIDYTTLNIDSISYEDIVRSKADILIISDNWGSGGGYYFNLSANECKAIAKYVNEGHGLYISAGTFNNFDNSATQPHVDYLAELVGLNSSLIYDWTTTSVPSAVNLLKPAHPIFNKISDPYHCSYSGSNCIPVSGDWTTALSAGEVLAISNDKKTAIIAKANRVYHSSLPECNYYGISDKDYQFIYNVILYTAAQPVVSWLSYDPASGMVAPDSALEVEVKIRSADLLPDSTYHREISIASNDPDDFENPFLIPAALTVRPTDYYFRINPAFQDSTGKAGDTLAYTITIKNFGQLTDNYNLNSSGNLWQTSFWDSTGTIPITNIGPVTSKAEAGLVIKVAIPNDTKYGDLDTAKIHISSVGKTDLSRFVLIQTMSVGTPDTIPWFDCFLTAALDKNKWIDNIGPAEVNLLGKNEPSPPYALNLNGFATGGDQVQSTLVDLSGDSLAILSYYYQRTGGGDSPEINDDLWVEYLNSSGNWKNLKRYPGDGPDDTTFTLEEILLPRDAYHNAFRIKFLCSGSNSSANPDDWFIDDVFVTRPPKIAAMPSNYDVTVLATDSIEGKPPLMISNSGEGILRYRILSLPGGGTGSSYQMEPATRDYPEDYYSQELDKDQADTRTGTSVIYNTGGPDKYGYFWIDSDEAGGPKFNWIDISAVGKKIVVTGDDANVGFFPIGFTFPFYGNQFTMFRCCINGFISFTSSSSNAYNEPIPNRSIFNLIAPFWDDLYFDSNSSAYYHFDGKKLIIQFNNVKRDYYNEYNTFEILLYPEGDIKFQYLNMQSSSNSATIGIQNDAGTDGLEIAFNTNYVRDRLAIHIATGVPWLKFDQPSGIIAQNSIDTCHVMFTAKNIDLDTVLYAKIVIRSNDPLDSSLVLPARLRVITNQRISGKILSGGKPVDGAVAQVWDEYPEGSIIDQDTTAADGTYLLLVPPEGGMFTVRSYAHGFFPNFKEEVPGNTDNLNFVLKPIMTISPTTEWVDFFSNNSKFWGGPVQVGDVITVGDPDSVVCGIGTVRQPANYGFMPVYQDDATTPDIDEGAQPGDTLTFKINGYLAQTLGPDSPVWTSHGSICQVDLKVEEIDTVKIPLIAGWNLVSWNVKPPEDSSHIILADILPHIVVVLGYEKGGLTFDPQNPEPSNLKEMDHFHGYWIKMAKADTLLIIGNPMKYEQTPIECETGWNLVSYLPQEADSIKHALHTLFDHIVRIYGFKAGALTFDPKMPQFNTLHILCPTFGYWIYLSQNDTLTYPKPLPGISYPDKEPMVLMLANATNHHRGDLLPSTEWINLFGKGIQFNNELLPVGTIIDAVDPDGVLCGEFVVENPGKLGFMPIYRDDPQTDIDEGATTGDEISIYFNNFELPVKIIWRAFGEVVNLGSFITAVVGELKDIPTSYQLSHNYPNPFNPETVIKFQLPEPGYITLKIFNVLGQEVRTLVAEEKKAGYYQVTWDGRDSQGTLVANGIYLYKLKAGNYDKTQKMLMLK